MASANVERVRSIRGAWEDGDFSRVDWAHPAIEFIIVDGPAPGRWTGLDGMAEGWQGWLSAWEEFRVEATEFRELDGERVLVVTRVTGRGRTSGLELGQVRTRGAELFHLREAQVTKLVLYFNADRALAELAP